jgi:hypothetical protein
MHSFNPIAPRAKNARAEINNAKVTHERFHKLREFVADFNAPAEKAILVELEKQIRALDVSIREATEQVASYEASMQETDKLLTKCSSSLRAVKERSRAENAEKLKQEQSRIKSLTAGKMNLEADLRAKKSLFDEKQTIDRDYVAGILLSLEQTIPQLEADACQSNELALKIDEAIDEIVDRLYDVRHDMCAAKKRLDRAQELDAAIKLANNQAQQEELRCTCTREFGKREPLRVIEEETATIERLRRRETKLCASIEKEVRRLTIAVKTVVIDGNNVLHNGKDYVGPAPLVALTHALLSDERIEKVIVVFDNNGPRRMKMTRSQVSAMFDRRIEVHITPPKCNADESVLQAADDPTTHVISNDKYGDYLTKPAVRDGRVYNHETINGEISVKELGVRAKVPFEPTT